MEETLEVITCLVAAHYGATSRGLRGPSRTGGIVRARHVAMYLAQRLVPLTKREIGMYFGGRSYSTVCSSCRTIEGFLEVYPAFKVELDALSDRILAALANRRRP